MGCEVETTDEFREWFEAISEPEREDVMHYVKLLQAQGVNLTFPYSSSINGSRHGQMRELRIKHQGRPYRVLYAFDPRRVAMLLLGDDKGGDSRWYKRNIPIADNLFDQHLADLRKDGLI
jgi:hypothetical protein